MKKFTAILLLSILGLPFTACNRSDEATTVDAEPQQTNLADSPVPERRSQTEKAVNQPATADSTNLDNQAYFDTPCVNEIESHLSVMPDNFTIDPTADNTLKGKKGTVLVIPANSLQFKSGKTPTGPVNVNLTECYDLSDFLGENLATLSKGNLLETGGMVKVLATSGGRELEVKKGAAFKVAMPQKVNKTNMQLFYGQAHNDQPVDWVLASNNNEAQVVNATELQESTDDTEPLTSIDREEEYVLSVGIRTIAIGYKGKEKNITYFLKDRAETLMDYLVNNFEITEELYRDFASDQDLASSMVDFQIDKTGKIISAELTYRQNLFSKALKDFLLTKAPRLDVETMYKSDFNTKYSVGLYAQKSFNQNKFNKKFEEKYGGNEGEDLTEVDQTDMNYYLFSATKFGWINCDRFYNNPAPKVDFIVDVPNPKNAKVMLAFESVSSVMQGSLENNRWVFRNLPEGEKVKVIAVTYKEKSPALAVERTIIQSQKLPLKNFLSFSLNELTAELNSLN